MGRIEADAREIEGTLKRTGYNLKHGFTWRGALTSPFRRGAPKLTGKSDIAPVFTNDYTPRTPSKSPTRARGGKSVSPKPAPAQGSRGTNGISEKKEKKGADGASPAAKPRSAGHVPEGFDDQLDVLDSLMDGLNAQALAINAELRQQNEGIEVLADRIEPAAVEVTSQSNQIKRRFRIK